MDELIRFEQNTALLNPESSRSLAELERQVKALEVKRDELKARIYEEMAKKKILKITTDDLTITRIAPTSTEKFNKAQFRKEHPDLYDTYITIGNKQGYVKLEVKE